MATVSSSVEGGGIPHPIPDKPDPGNEALHRVRTVRRQQGVSLRSAARHLGTDIRHTRSLENESTDLKLSDLYKWQKALDVPITDLLVDPEGPLSRPVLEPSRMIRLMKTTPNVPNMAK